MRSNIAGGVFPAPIQTLYQYRGGNEVGSLANEFNTPNTVNLNNSLIIPLLKLVVQILAQLQQNTLATSTPTTTSNTPASTSNAKPTLSPVADEAWETDRGDIMLYGDPEEDRIVPVKLSTFERLPDIDIDAERVYAADHVTDDKSYVMNRGSNFISVLERDPETQAFTETRRIELPFHPRTGAKNTTLGLELITGVDKPMFGLVDYTTDTLVASGGRNEVTEGQIDNYDGENASGHGVWLSDNQFVVPDRENNTLSLYGVEQVKGRWQVTLQDTVTAPSSAHTIEKGSNGVSYVGLEGSAKNNIPAGLGELVLNGTDLNLNRVANVPGNDVASQGTHHPANHPNGKTVYLGDNAGFVHVIDRETMNVIKSIPAGKGAGHVTFIPERNMALVTNHEDTFLTVIDMTTNEVIKNIEVATDSPDYNSSLQAHTGRVSPDKQYFYNFASDSGTFFRVNLDTLALDGQIYTGGTPKQASQPGELTLGYQGEVGATEG